MKIFRVFAVLLLVLTVRNAGAALGPSPTPAEPLFSASIRQGDLVSLQGKSIRRFDESSIAHVRFFAILYSDSANAACKGVLPGLVDYYNETKPGNPHFELIMVPRDASQVLMDAAIKKFQIKFPVLAFSKTRSHKTLNKFVGPGIPCMVLIDAHGKVLSNCYKDGKFLGTSVVLDDIKKTLKENPATPEDVAAANAAAKKSEAGSSTSGGSSFDDLFKKR